MSERISQFLDLMGTLEAVDLTHTMEEKMPTFPSHSKYYLNRWLSPGDPALVNVMIIGDHAGTHFDAPAHFVHDENSPVRKFADEVDCMALVGRAKKLTFGPFAPDNATVSVEDIRAWEAENTEICEDDIVFFDYQWGRDKWGPVDESNAFLENWPGLSKSAVDYLIEKKIRVAGTDCASIDSADGDGFVFPGHFELLGSGILIIENLANLHLLPSEFIFMAFPLKIKLAGGSPIRAVALIPRD